MNVDLGPTLGANPGLTRDTLDALDERVGTIHRELESRRDAGEFGYAALELPHRTDLETITDAVAEVPDPGAVLTVGIGGSALGAATLTDALGTDVPHVTLDNVDPAFTRETLEALPLADTVMLAVSKSGTTTETLTNFLLAREAIDDAGGDWRDQTVVVTGEGGALARTADRHDLPRLAFPGPVPGRYAMLSPVGLAAAVLCGLDAAAILEGAAAVADDLSGSLYETPAYAYAGATHALEQRGATVNAMMPYAESLETFAEWFAQLWAESLGKAGRGQLPARALGTTDQHSQLQRYRGGPRDTVVTVVEPAERPSCPLPEPGAATLDAIPPSLDGGDLADVMSAQLEATVASLVEAERPVIRIDIDRVDARSLGALCHGLTAACVMAGELAGTNPFDQPAVEWGKQAAQHLLAGDSTAALDVPLPSLRVEGGH
jgi:glucose-6-phosphate isomerase